MYRPCSVAQSLDGQDRVTNPLGRFCPIQPVCLNGWGVLGSKIDPAISELSQWVGRVVAMTLSLGMRVRIARPQTADSDGCMHSSAYQC
jgi:hypothetical protein